MRRTAWLCALALSLGASSVRADFITGQVVDSMGVGVPGVDIDVKNLGSGGDPPIFNDGTDANGFFTTTVPAGFYRVTFTPPPPPTTTHLVLVVEDVTVVGTTAMGTLSLSPGVSVSGRAVDSGNQPVAGVNLDVYDLTAGDNLVVAGDFTDAAGLFSVAVPIGPIELRFDTTPVVGPTLAPEALELNLSQNTMLGDHVLAPGFLLSGTVRRPGGIPVEEVDLDVIASATGEEIWTPGDSTAANGTFSMAVPAGTWDVEICPPFEESLVATDVEGLSVSANQNLGVFNLQSGVVLAGNVTTHTGAPAVGANLDVTFSSSGSSVVTCNDSADSAGNYAVIVPTGTLDVAFQPVNYSVPLGVDSHPNLVISGATALNGTLSPCPFGTSFGTGRAGSGGFVPVLETVGGAPRMGNSDWALRLKRGLGGGNAILVLSLRPLRVPSIGGAPATNSAAWTYLPSNPGMVVFGNLGGNPGVPGAGVLTFPPPVSIDFLVGETLYAQFGVFDPAAPLGVSLSNALRIDFCP